jgi:hypothetical protein
VKALAVGPDHESFSKRGGIHHYYAKDKAVAGYRTGIFPKGSILVDEAVFTKEVEGPFRISSGRTRPGACRRRSGHVLRLSREGADGPRVQSATTVRLHERG